MKGRKLFNLIFLLLAIYFLVFSKYGLIRLLKLHSEINHWKREIIILDASRILLTNEIRRLKTSPSYLRLILRERYGIER